MRIKDVVSKRLQIFKKKPDVQYGVIGDIATGLINVPDRSSIIYITLLNGVILNNVLNIRVPNMFGLGVSIGYDGDNLPNTLQVLGIRDSYIGGSYNLGDILKGVGYHRTQHEWPNGDTVYVWGEQFLPSLFVPAPDTLVVGIYPGSYFLTDSWKVFATAETVSLVSIVGALTSGHARFALIVVDDAGTLQVRVGDLVDEVTGPPFISAYESLTDADIPLPEDGDKAICAVKLFYGQTYFRFTSTVNDFIDMRFTSSSSGSGSSSGGHIIQNEGTPLATEPNLDFAGDGVLATDVPGSTKTLVTIPGAHIIEDNETPVDSEPALNFTGDVNITDEPGIRTTIEVSANHFYIDQSGGTGDTYGILGGARNGVNTEYTVSQGSYISGTVKVYLNGQLLTQGSAEDWHEASAVAGTIHMWVAPEATDEITVTYGYLGAVSVPPGMHIIQEEGGNLTARSKLNFVGTIVTASDDAGNDATKVTIDAPVYHGQLIWTIESIYLGAAYQGLKPLRLWLPYVGAGATIEEIVAVVNTAPTASNLRLDIHKNGSTIFSGTAYVEIPTTQYSVSRTTNFTSSGAIAKDDYFQLELVQGDSVAADLVVHMRYKWTPTGV
jgi:hypothetical protein